MNFIILISGILTFFIGFIAFKNSNKRKDAKLFSFFCLITSIWIILNFFSGTGNSPRLLGYIYATGTFVGASLLSWTYVYVKNGNKKWKHILLYLIAFLIAILSIFSELIVSGKPGINNTGPHIKEGSLFAIFGIFLAFSVITALVKVFLAYLKAEGKKKKKIRLILFGITGFTGFSILVSSILPIFGIIKFTNFDSPSALIFVVFTSLAIIRHDFLRIKIILAQIFVAFMTVLLALHVFFPESDSSLFMRVVFFLAFFIAGIMLMESITLEVKRKEELEVANAKLLKLDKSKSEFISIASHQLRTPLTTMYGFISVLKNGSYGQIPENLKEPIRHIEVANEKLMNLTEELLSVSRLENGKMEFDLKEFDINNLIESIADSFLLQAQERKIKLEIKKAKKLPLIKIDQTKMFEAISNIVDNAIKYTNKGHVSIATFNKKDAVQIIIKDTGIGLSKEDKTKLFEKFSRGKDARQMKKNGAGLGLFFSKKIINFHKGKIDVFSNGRGKGTKFVIEIPVSK